MRRRDDVEQQQVVARPAPGATTDSPTAVESAGRRRLGIERRRDGCRDRQALRRDPGRDDAGGGSLTCGARSAASPDSAGGVGRRDVPVLRARVDDADADRATRRRCASASDDGAPKAAEYRPPTRTMTDLSIAWVGASYATPAASWSVTTSRYRPGADGYVTPTLRPLPVRAAGVERDDRAELLGDDEVDVGRVDRGPATPSGAAVPDGDGLTSRRWRRGWRGDAGRRRPPGG